MTYLREVTETAASFNEFYNRWCKREHVECDALKDWKLNIFKIIDRSISFYCSRPSWVEPGGTSRPGLQLLPVVF